MRLFFAYWPDPYTAEEIADWVVRAHGLFGGRPMRTDTLHMTLAFLGEASEEQAQALTEACVDWCLPSGSMVLHEPGRFGNARVVWLGPGPESESLAWLYTAHERLWAQLAPFGWEPRESQFRPHVSLLRNAGPGSLELLKGEPVQWSPGRCVLVASRPTDTGSRYTVLAEVPVGS